MLSSVLRSRRAIEVNVAIMREGDIIESCPLIYWTADTDQDGSLDVRSASPNERVIVLTQACDLSNAKATKVQVAIVHATARLVNEGILKPLPRMPVPKPTASGIRATLFEVACRRGGRVKVTIFDLEAGRRSPSVTASKRPTRARGRGQARVARAATVGSSGSQWFEVPNWNLKVRTVADAVIARVLLRNNESQCFPPAGDVARRRTVAITLRRDASSSCWPKPRSAALPSGCRPPMAKVRFFQYTVDGIGY